MWFFFWPAAGRSRPGGPDGAVLRLQALARRRRARAALVLHRQAATRLQTVQRGRMARRWYVGRCTLVGDLRSVYASCDVTPAGASVSELAVRVCERNGLLEQLDGPVGSGGAGAGSARRLLRNLQLTRWIDREGRTSLGTFETIALEGDY